MNCPELFIKYGMCVVNGLFVVLGIALIVVGGVSLTRAGEYQSLLSDGFFSIPALLLTIGLFVTILFFFGCWGLHKKSYCMLMTFAVLLGVILVMEVIGGISAYVLRDRTSEVFDKTLYNSFSETFSPNGTHANDTESHQMWNAVQNELQCCGLYGPKDYTNYTAINATTFFPVGCCNETLAIPCSNTTIANMYQDGCQHPITVAVEGIISSVAKWAILVAVLHLLWIIGACHFAVKFRLNYESV